MTGKKILVTENHKFMRAYLESTLRGAGYEVRTASNAREALEISAEFHPDLILTSIQTPIDCFGYAKVLREQGHTGAIVELARGNSELEKYAKRHGVGPEYISMITGSIQNSSKESMLRDIKKLMPQ